MVVCYQFPSCYPTTLHKPTFSLQRRYQSVKVTCLWRMRYWCYALTSCNSIATMDLRVFIGSSQFSECWWKLSGRHIGKWAALAFLGHDLRHEHSTALQQLIVPHALCY